MGESKLKRLQSKEMLLSCAGVQTAGEPCAGSLGSRQCGDADGATGVLHRVVSPATSTLCGSPILITRSSRSASSTATGRTRKTLSMNSRISGAGAASPRTPRIAANYRRAQWR